jgi:hypothetical protein
VPEGLYSGTWLPIRLFTHGVVIGIVQNMGSLATEDKKTNEERFQDLLLSWGKLAAQRGILVEGVSQELEKTATVDVRGFGGFAKATIPLEGVNENNYRGFKLDAVKGSRRFFVTSNGLMGMAPPHVEEGDLACVLFGAQVPFLLRKINGFYTLVGEAYISDGYMYGRAIDEMEAGRIRVQEFEIR